MEDKTLKLFKLFHYLKEVTTKSYSLKKLQDLVERRLDKQDSPISEDEYEQFIQEYHEIYNKLKSSLENIEELTK
jgi:hypothetical protein